MRTHCGVAVGLAAVLLGSTAGRLAAQGAMVAERMTRELAGAADREVLVLTVEYGPGVSEPVHRHEAQAFVYMLEGSIEMQVRGNRAVTLQPGDTFYEGPDDVHVVGRNASTTQPARFVVVLIKKKGAPVVLPVP